VRKALSTLPWVEKDTIAPDHAKQQVTFAVKDKKSFDLKEVKKVIKEKAGFEVGKVLSGPETPGRPGR
jgi:hypothetical protein